MKFCLKIGAITGKGLRLTCVDTNAPEERMFELLLGRVALAPPVGFLG